MGNVSFGFEESSLFGPMIILHLWVFHFHCLSLPENTISLLFQNIFNISNFKSPTHIYLWNVVNQIIFSWTLQIWYVEVWISRSISVSPLEFEITRVNCTLQDIFLTNKCYTIHISKKVPKENNSITTHDRAVFLHSAFSLIPIYQWKVY